VIARAIEKTENKKLGPVSATYAAQVSCPDSCPFLGAGCYAELGNSFAGFTTHRLNQSAKDGKAGHLAVARAEAREIANLSGDRPLRLHVVGDAKSDEAAQILARASKRFEGKVWTYTHAWSEVKRRSWGGVSVLASCETTTQARQAMKKGYAAAIVLADLPADGKAFEKDGVKIIPCPEQTRGVPCVECRLCWKDQWLLNERAVIGLAAHGTRKEQVKGLVQIR
jgi:hypothetical protein